MRLWTDRSGNTAIAFAVLSPLLFCAVGIGVDFQARLAQKDSLQDAADTLALRGARELLLKNATDAMVEAMLSATAEKQFGPTLGVFRMTPHADETKGEVFVEITQPSRNSFFLSKIVPHEDPIIVDAIAVAQGVTNVCVIALEENDADAVKASLDSKLEARKCAIMSNSTSATGINVSGKSKISAGFICSAGGAEGGGLNFSPAPLLDCPQYTDPLAERMPPDVSGCDHIDKELSPSAAAAAFGMSMKGGSAVGTTSPVSLIDGATRGTLQGYTRFDIEPGVYCGGLKINGLADVHAAPGVYVMKDGPLTIDTGGRLFGENVGIYFEGDASVFDFKVNSIVHLTAPKTGLMAGLLFRESSSAKKNRLYTISSDNARELLGTIYLPRGVLNVNTMKPIADSSAYTAIIANKIALKGKPQLVLNTDYGATDVPTPEGVGPTGGAVYLRE